MFDKPYHVADIGANHDGSLERALMLIELAAECGANAAKFQNYTADGLVSKKGFSGEQKGHQKNWTKSVWQTYNDASTPLEWTEQLKRRCDACGIDYFTSPYEIEIVDYVDKFVDIYKIGSGDITFKEIVKHIAAKNKPVILATGAATLAEVMQAVLWLEDVPLVLMQCNTNYTATAENMKHINLNVLKRYREIYPAIKLGLSDHTFGHTTAVGAVALGATVIEKHFTDDRQRPGNDHSFAMMPDEWADMVRACNEVFYALGDGEKRIQDNEKESSYVQRRGLRYNKPLAAGDRIQPEDLVALRPEQGISPADIDVVIGGLMVKDVDVDDPVMAGDFY